MKPSDIKLREIDSFRKGMSLINSLENTAGNYESPRRWMDGYSSELKVGVKKKIAAIDKYISNKFIDDDDE